MSVCRGKQYSAKGKRDGPRNNEAVGRPAMGRWAWAAGPRKDTRKGRDHGPAGEGCPRFVLGCGRVLDGSGVRGAIVQGIKRHLAAPSAERRSLAAAPAPTREARPTWASGSAP